MEIQALFAALTNEEKAVAAQGFYKLRGTIYCRGKKAAAEFVARGFEMEKISPQYYAITCEQSKALYELASVHGEAVKVMRIDEKYDDSMGAFEVMIVADANGKEWGVGNMYDQSACFRTMTTDDRLAYANKNS
ncbi:hypothetical protein D3C78_1000630 [compost metagenome]